MSLQDIKSEVGAAYREQFVVKSNAGTGLLRYTDADKIKSFILSAIDRAVSEARQSTEVEAGIEWMQEGYHKDLKGYTKGHTDALAQVQKSWQSFMGKGEGLQSKEEKP